MLQAANAARILGLDRISAIEFGVAGGNGLLDLEAAAAVGTRFHGVAIDVYGFDSGVGLPPPADLRDAPWAAQPGWFAMDEAKLRARLTKAELVLGPVAETVPNFLAEGHAPVGFAAFDLDFYSSTADALRLLRAGHDRVLPRVVCYFDDIFGFGWSEFTGELAAIEEFNGASADRKLGAVKGLRWSLPPSQFTAEWPEKIYVAHAFDHPRYRDTAYRFTRAFLDGLDVRPPN